jgi:large subunit ribosomal protein L17
VRALVINGKIKITEAKAKELRPLIEKMITKARKETIHNRRVLASRTSDEVAEKLIKEIAPKYKDRPGGYTRIIKTGQRFEDGARMAIIELV